MLAFCGQDKCSIDANGRIKLSPRVIADFQEQCGGNVVLHCLPEGSVAVYPENVYLQMRMNELRPAERAAESFSFRRSLRRFGAMSQSENISAQGRITVPEAYREFAGIKSGSDVVVVGVQIGVEIWSQEKWAQEMNDMHEFAREKGRREMDAELADVKGNSTGGL